MRSLRAASIATVSLGCLAHAAPAGELPPNTVLLSSMMQQLSEQPGFTEKFLAEVEGGARKAGSQKGGAALLTPELIHLLRERILGKDWQGLDRFPGWTMAEINPTVRVVGHEAGKDAKVEGAATAGGAPAKGAEGVKTLAAFLDLGDYGLTRTDVADFTKPATGKGFEVAEYVSSLGDGVTRGDGPSALAPEHAESTRLAEVLNRLSLNGMDGIPVMAATWSGRNVTKPEDLIAAIGADGHQIVVNDARYFANFGHLHFNGQDVMMPFFVNSQILVPHTKRPLLVPVSHAEYEWHIRGPQMNADVAFYFGIDGHAEWRTMDQLDQAWVMKRNAYTYTGADALEVTRLNAAMVRAYARLHQAHPKIPFGGYYAFGVCQDEVAAIEEKMTGKTTLFPNTADERFFNDPRDEEINELIKKLPKDRDGRLPQVERIFGSLPVGDSDAELRTVMIPGLGADLVAVHDAWTNGTLKRTRHGGRRRWWLFGFGAVLAAAVLLWARRGKGR